MISSSRGAFCDKNNIHGAEALCLSFTDSALTQMPAAACRKKSSLFINGAHAASLTALEGLGMKAMPETLPVMAQVAHRQAATHCSCHHAAWGKCTLFFFSFLIQIFFFFLSERVFTSWYMQEMDRRKTIWHACTTVLCKGKVNGIYLHVEGDV